MIPDRWLPPAFLVVTWIAVCWFSTLALGQPIGAESVDGPPAGAVTSMERGREMFRTGEYEEALNELSKAIRTARDGYGEASLWLGKTYFELKEYEAAKSAFEDAVRDLEWEESDTLKAEANHGLGKTLMELGGKLNFENAIQKLDEAARLERSNAEYVRDQGIINMKLGNVVRAEKILNRAIELDSEDAEAYDARGQARGYMQKFEESHADFKAAIERDATDKTFYYNEGRIYVAEKDFANAINSFTQAMQVAEQQRKADEETEGADEPDPPYVEPLISRASALIEIGKISPPDQRVKAYQAAQADCGLGLQLAKDNPELAANSATFLYMMGVAQRLAGDLAPAIDSFSQALNTPGLIERQPPFAAEVYLRRGIVWYYNEDLELAQADFSEAARMNYQDVRPSMWLGFTYVKQDKYTDAINAYSEAMAKNRRYAPAFNNRGLAYMQLGEYEKAIEDFNNAIRVNPGDAEAYYRRGVALRQLGDNEKAVASFAAAAGHDPTSERAHRKLADLYGRLGRRELAAQHRRRADELAQAPEESYTGAGAPGSLDDFTTSAGAPDAPDLNSVLDAINSTLPPAGDAISPLPGGGSSPSAGPTPLGGELAPDTTGTLPGLGDALGPATGDTTTPPAGDTTPPAADDSNDLFNELFPKG